MNEKIPGKISVHIAFHYNPERIVYLSKVINNVKGYVFDRTAIFVHTNQEAGKDHIGKLFPEVECIVHGQLSDPFRLTWVCRDVMETQLDEFDYFMYLEDDILVPSQAIHKWCSDMNLISQTGYLRGFVRIEFTPEGQLRLTDFTKRITAKKIRIGKELFFNSPKPYNAFWIYTKEQMLEFIKTPSWTDEGRCPWDVRERAAAGMLFEDIPENSLSKTLIPLSGETKIDPDAFVYHLPNNYAVENCDKRRGYGTIHPDRLICSSYLEKALDYLSEGRLP